MTLFLWILLIIEVWFIWFWVEKERRSFTSGIIWPSWVLLGINWFLFCVGPQIKGATKKKVPEFSLRQWKFWIKPEWNSILIKIVLFGVVIAVATPFVIMGVRKIKSWEAKRASEKRLRIFGEQEIEVFEKIDYDPQPYFTEDDRYFVGLDKDKKPRYINRKDLPLHGEVVGPSGMGKTEYLLVLAAQAIKKRDTLIFVDGKGDLKFARKLNSLCSKEKVNMKIFCPGKPECSYTYNPLLSSQDPGEIADLIITARNWQASGDSEYYINYQKRGLLDLAYFLKGYRYNFRDIVRFLDSNEAREKAYLTIKDNSEYKTEVQATWKKLKDDTMSGLSNDLSKRFVKDEEISPLVNAYESEINIKDVLEQGGVLLFSFMTGVKPEANEALAKMVLANIAFAVGKRQVSGEKRFALVILDEFGQYVSEKFDKFIATARSTNVTCILSHQTTAQLEISGLGEKLKKIVIDNTQMKSVFCQGDEADYWAKFFGTKPEIQRSEQIEQGTFYTEKLSTMGSARYVRGFNVSADTLRNLKKGQIAYRSVDTPFAILNLGMLKIEEKPLGVVVHNSKAEGLCL
uniref:TraD/TraG TraM recognition site domain-containing protein n=1 Tax=candidate division CPR3 bacterium TaxID=2268181 RepID=A0A7C5YW99_UNCC3